MMFINVSFDVHHWFELVIAEIWGVIYITYAI